MIIAPELSIDELSDYTDSEGRVNIDVTVPSDFLEKWRDAEEEEWETHDPSLMTDVVETMLEEIFCGGDLPETAYESLEQKDENSVSYDVDCVFSFELLS